MLKPNIKKLSPSRLSLNQTLLETLFKGGACDGIRGGGKGRWGEGRSCGMSILPVYISKDTQCMVD
jgi:hypothetical protein